MQGHIKLTWHNCGLRKNTTNAQRQAQNNRWCTTCAPSLLCVVRGMQAAVFAGGLAQQQPPHICRSKPPLQYSAFPLVMQAGATGAATSVSPAWGCSSAQQQAAAGILGGVDTRRRGPLVATGCDIQILRCFGTGRSSIHCGQLKLSQTGIYIICCGPECTANRRKRPDRTAKCRAAVSPAATPEWWYDFKGHCQLAREAWLHGICRDCQCK